MILDNFALLAGSYTAQGVLTGTSFNGAATAVGPNSIDMGPLTLGGNQVGDVGAGEPLEVAISVITAPTVGTTCQYQLVQADDAALTSNVQVINSTAAFPIASLPAGTVVPLHYDRAAPFAPKRFVGIQVVTVGAIATHAIAAAVVKNVADVKNILFKNGFAVS